MIIQWWYDRTTRERAILLGGGLLLLLLCGYRYCWSPLTDAVMVQQQQLQSQRDLLPMARALHQRAPSEQVRQSSQALLVVIEKAMRDNQLQPYIKGISQPQSNQVQLRFEAAPFDVLMTVTQTLLKQQIYIDSINLTKTNTAGAVKGMITLMR